MAANFMFKRCRKNVGRGGHNVRINSADGQARAWNSSIGVQTGYRWAQSCASEGGKLESERRFTAGTLDKDWPRRRICVSRCECGQDKSRRIPAELLLNVGWRQP